MRNTIWNSGCPCGEYETKNVKCFASCRKSNEAIEYFGDLVKYKVKTTKELAMKDIETMLSEHFEDRTVDLLEIK